MKRLIWAFLSLLLLPTLSWGQHDLSGRIVDKNTSEPLAGVVLTLTEIDAQVETNQAGVYRFSDVPEGTYNLVVRAENYLSFGIRISVRANKSQDFRMILTKNVTDEVLITAIKASDQTATTYSVLDQEAIQKRNFGQDVPFLLNEIPGVVVNSDAGAGIGYTAMRIRGSDATRINITLNGIPYNDPESHGTFWVNLPDFASSVDNIQVQRGVGNSTNGAAAFGASINLQTTKLNYEPYAELANSYGSFNTWKNTLTAGTGLIKDKFSFDLRLSNIHSDGWVDRAETDLRSFFVSGGYYGKKTLLKFNVFAGQERTYQSWWGVPEEYLDDPVLRRDNYYTYENETDNYWQDHYQLLFAHELSDELNLNLALHYTKGRGYFEQFREGDSFREYPIFSFNELVVNNDTLTETNLIRRRWLDNDFYGTTYSLDYQPSDRIRLTLGGAANQYDGDHFGEVIWAEHAQGTDLGDRYYDNRALKTDVNTYLKGSIQLTDALNLYADLQYRHIDYQIGDSTLERPGNDNDQSPIIGDFNFNFFNPKVGLTYQFNQASHVYGSVSLSKREPVRTDFIDAPDGATPTHESLTDVELGYRYRTKGLQFAGNLYFMDYQNQLIPTGALNDVGSALRQNVPDSYRAGIELDASWQISRILNFRANFALSRNKIANFAEVLYNYDPYEVIVVGYNNTDIAFSPNVVGGASLNVTPVAGLEMSLLGKYVGRQFLDNTSNEARSLDRFFVTDLRINYGFQTTWAKEIRLGLLVNNLLNAQYEPNGYTYSYLLGAEQFTFNFYYPQAGTNLLASLAIRF